MDLKPLETVEAAVIGGQPPSPESVKTLCALTRAMQAEVERTRTGGTPPDTVAASAPALPAPVPPPSIVTVQTEPRVHRSPAVEPDRVEQPHLVDRYRFRRRGRGGCTIIEPIEEAL